MTTPVTASIELAPSEPTERSALEIAACTYANRETIASYEAQIARLIDQPGTEAWVRGWRREIEDLRQAKGWNQPAVDRLVAAYRAAFPDAHEALLDDHQRAAA